MPSFITGDTGTFVPQPYASDGGSILTPGEGASVMSNAAASQKQQGGFVGWITNLFRQMGAAASNNVYGLTGLKTEQDIVTEDGNLYTKSQQDQDLLSHPENPNIVSETAYPTKTGVFGNMDVNDPDSMIKAAEDLYEKYPDLAEIFLNYGLSEKSNNAQFNRSLEASNTTYQRMVKDLQAAGLNPFLALQGMSGSQVSSGSTSYGNSSISSMVNNTNTNKRGLTAAGIAALALILANMFRLLIFKH